MKKIFLILFLGFLNQCGGELYNPFGPGKEGGNGMIEIPIAIKSPKQKLDLLSAGLSSVYMAISGCSSGYSPTNFLFNGSTINMYPGDTGCMLSICSFIFNGESYPNQTPPCGTFNKSNGSLTSYTGTGGANPGGNTVYALVVSQLPSPISASSTATFYILEDDDFGNTNIPVTGNYLSLQNSSPSTAPYTVAASTTSVSFLFKLLYPNPPPTSAWTVNYYMTGSAVAGVDYTAPSGTLTFPANSSTATLTVNLINNANARETPQSLGVALASSSGYQGVSTYQGYGNPSVMITNTSTTIPGSSAGLVYQGTPSTFVQSGGVVTSWSDASGSGNGVTFTAQSSPAYNASGLNGLATVGFNGSNYLALASKNSAINSAPGGYTSKIISMAFVTASDVTTRQVLYQQGDAASGLNIYIYNGELWASEWASSGTNYNVSAYIAPNTAYSMSFVYDGTNLLLSLYLSGLLVDTQTITTTLAKSTAGVGIGGNAGTTKFENGSTATAVTGFLGKIAEYLHYNGPTITSTFASSTCAYLDEKYAMTFPAVSVSAVSPVVSTDPAAKGFLVSRSIATSSDLTVYYTMSGTAVAGTNYVALPGSVTIPKYTSTVYTGLTGIYAGTGTTTLTMTLQNDASSGTVPVTYVGAQNSASLNIVPYAAPGSAVLVSWLDAAVGVTTAGGNVSSWVDRSGNAINATAVSGHYPTNVSTAPQHMVFAGTSTSNAQEFSLTTNALLDSAASYTQKTFAFVFTTGSDVTTRQVLYTQGNTTNGMNIVVSGGKLYFTGYGTTGWTTNPNYLSTAVATNSQYYVILEYDEVHNQMRGMINGSVVPPVVSGVGTLTGVASSTEIGAIKSTGIKFYDGTTSTTANSDYLLGGFKISEVILLNGVLNSSDYTALQSYLRARYGL